jgi:hypothetical protein
MQALIRTTQQEAQYHMITEVTKVIQVIILFLMIIAIPTGGIRMVHMVLISATTRASTL